ncbi:MAG: CcdB family protein [Acetobacteraceae bacterium]
MAPDRPLWLDVVRHRVRGVGAPYLLIMQHHDVPASTLLAAPITRSVERDTDVLAPRLSSDGEVFRVRLLDIAAVPRSALRDVVGSASGDADAILNALDIILHGYPAGRPR